MATELEQLAELKRDLADLAAQAERRGASSGDQR